MKDTTVDRTVDAVRLARELGYGVTGNFVIDPDWGESDFERLWGFVERHDLGRAGFTILTPLPGTAFFEEMRPRLRAVKWSQYDMHHVLWEPRLGATRFFELYCETWRRSILNLQRREVVAGLGAAGAPADVPFLTRMLIRTQRMMRPDAYLREHALAEPVQDVAQGFSPATPQPEGLRHFQSYRDTRNVSSADRHVDGQIVEPDRLAVAAGKGHPHLHEQEALAIDPELEPLEPFLNLLPLRPHVDAIGVAQDLVRFGRDVEHRPQLFTVRLGEILIDALLRLRDVDRLALVRGRATPRRSDLPSMATTRRSGVRVGHQHAQRAAPQSRCRATPAASRAGSTSSSR